MKTSDIAAKMEITKYRVMRELSKIGHIKHKEGYISKKRKVAKNPNRAMRLCLGDRHHPHMFMSEGIHNRVCDACKCRDTVGGIGTARLALQ